MVPSPPNDPFPHSKQVTIVYTVLIYTSKTLSIQQLLLIRRYKQGKRYQCSKHTLKLQILKEKVSITEVISFKLSSEDYRSCRISTTEG